MYGPRIASPGANRLRFAPGLQELLVRVANARKRGSHFAQEPDPCSSGRWFDGWRDVAAGWAPGAPVARPGTWLLGAGWRRCRSIAVAEVPAG